MSSHYAFAVLAAVPLGALAEPIGVLRPNPPRSATIDISSRGGYLGIPSQSTLWVPMSKALHESHPGIVKRLKRADGHLRNVIEMIENGRTCLEIAQQLHAVENAVAAAKKALIHDHLDHCLEDAVGAVPRQQRSSVEEFKEITKYL